MEWLFWAILVGDVFLGIIAFVQVARWWHQDRKWWKQQQLTIKRWLGRQ
jgi:hypothetical protein